MQNEHKKYAQKNYFFVLFRPGDGRHTGGQDKPQTKKANPNKDWYLSKKPE